MTVMPELLVSDSVVRSLRNATDTEGESVRIASLPVVSKKPTVSVVIPTLNEADNI